MIFLIIFLSFWIIVYNFFYCHFTFKLKDNLSRNISSNSGILIFMRIFLIATNITIDSD